MARTKNLKNILILIIISYFFLLFGNGILSLSNPDEVFYAQIAREMSQRNSWMTPYIFGAANFEKPIFTYWLLRIGFLVFGVSSFSARFFPAVFAIIGVVAVYLLGLAGFRDQKKAFISALILASCGLYIGLARTLFTDMIFSVFILLSLFSFYAGYSSKDKRGVGLAFFFVFSGLAVLTKGPLGFLIPFLTVVLFLWNRKDGKVLLSKHFLAGFFLFLLVSLPWYIFAAHKYGQVFTHEFFYNDHYRRLIEAEHAKNDTWYFYPLSMFGCIFPWSLFSLAGVISLFKRLGRQNSPFLNFLLFWTAVTFLVFQFAHSKLVSYIFPFFPALALISGDFISDRLGSAKKSGIIFLLFLLSAFAVLLIPVALLIGCVAFWPYLSNYVGTSRVPLYCLMFSFFVLAAALLSFTLKKRLLNSIYTLAFVLPLALYFLPFMRSDVEPYISSKTACDYLLNSYTVNNTILTTKFLVRGVRYYTGKDAAVADIPGKQFFSPHPVPFLTSDQMVADFLRSQPVTYCIIRKSLLEDFKRLPAAEFKCEILKKIGTEYILRVEYLKASSHSG